MRLTAALLSRWWAGSALGRGLAALGAVFARAWDASWVARISRWEGPPAWAWSASRVAALGQALLEPPRRWMSGSRLPGMVEAAVEASALNRAAAWLGSGHGGAALLGLLIGAVPFATTAYLMAGVWILFGLRLLRGQLVPLPRLYLPMLLLAGALGLAVAGSVSPRDSLSALALWTTYLAAFLLAASTLTDAGRMRTAVAYALLGGTIVAIGGFVQYLTGTEVAENWVDPSQKEIGGRRIYVLFNNPNVLAEYLAFLIPAGLVLTLDGQGWLRRGASAAILGALGGTLVLTFSRGGWLATGLSLLWVGAVRNRRLLLILLVLGVLALILFPETIAQRAASAVNPEDTSNRYRISIWKAVGWMIQDHWLFGVGLGTDAFLKVYDDYLLAGTRAAHAHNLYLEQWVETGLIGLLALLMFVWFWYRDAWRTLSEALRRRGGKPLPAAGGMLAAAMGVLAGQLLHGLVDHIWYSPKIALFFWLWAGLGTAAARSLAADQEREAVAPGAAAVPARPRVLHICSDVNIGGAGRYLLYLLPELKRLGLAVTAACPEGPLAQALRRAGLPVRVVPEGDRSFSWRLLWHLIRLVRAERPHLVHTHASLAGRLAARLGGAGAVVYTKHGLAAGEEAAVQTRLARSGRRGWIWSAAFVAQRLADTLLADAVIAVSQAVARVLQVQGTPAGKIRVIHNGIALPGPSWSEGVVRPADGAPGSPGPVITTAGRLSPEKGQSFFIEMAALLRECYPEARFQVVGDGPLRNELAVQIDRLRLREVVALTGFRADVDELLRESHVFVLPSLAEGLGLVLLEAMAAGLPVVATKVGGIPEVVVDGVTGRLVPPGDAAALAAAVREVLDNPDLARRWGEAGRRRVEQSFTAAEMGRQTLDLYRGLRAGALPETVGAKGVWRG